jgi:hypothetical protein
VATPIRVVVKFNDFGKLAAEMRQKADDVCNTTAQQILTHSQTLIQSGPKTGRVYRHGNVLHRASAPGEAPATDTGNLVNSGYAKRARRALWHVGYTAEYARALEYGTPRILPRPYLRPAVEHFRQAFLDAMKQVLG